MDVKQIDWVKILDELENSSLIEPYEGKSYITSDVTTGELIGFIRGEIEAQQ